MVIGVEDWAEIRRLHRAEKMSVRAIGRKLGILRNMVRKAVANDRPPKYQRAPKGWIVDAVVPQIRGKLSCPRARLCPQFLQVTVEPTAPATEGVSHFIHARSRRARRLARPAGAETGGRPRRRGGARPRRARALNQ